MRNNLIVKNGLRFILLILLQVFVFNKLSILGFLIPYVYVAFVLLLPYNTGKSWLLILGFLTGLTVDFFGNSLGLHAAATTFLAFLRPGVLRFYFSKMEFQEGEYPGIQKLGVRGFLKYALTLVTIHHLTVVYLEVFTLHRFVLHLEQALLNTLYTVFVMFILLLPFTGRSGRRR